MLANYFKVAVRSLLKHKLYTLINISGLTVGLTCFLFIFTYVTDEWSYDKFHPNIDRLYRLNFYAKLGDQTAHTATSPHPAGPVFKHDFPEIEEFCRLRGPSSKIVHFDNQAFKEERIIYTDSTFFDVFPFALIAGEPSTALTQPNTVVVSEETAQKYFGSSNPLGKTLLFGNEPYAVTGVIENIPNNSHFQFDFFCALTGRAFEGLDNWGHTSSHNYFLLRDGADPQLLSEKATKTFVQHLSVLLEDLMNVSWDEFVNSGNYARVEFFPVSKIHLHSDLDDELGINNDARHVQIILVIGFFILLLACINFMNMATARASVRAKEVGLRKAIGALRSDLLKQFLLESIAMSAISLLLALVCLQLLMPFLNTLSGKAIEASGLFNIQFLMWALVVMGGTAFIAGCYPAFFLSRFQPVEVLKGTLFTRRPKSGLRNSLVIFQFFTTVVLLIGTFVMHQQLKFMQNRNLGFNKENVLVLHDAFLLGDHVAAFREKMLQHPSVSSVSIGDFLPVAAYSNTFTVLKGRSMSRENTILSNNWWVDHDYVKTMGLEIVEGRDFSRDISTDSTSALVNERMAREYGYPLKPVLGEDVSLLNDQGVPSPYQIVGVVKDFHFSSMRNSIEPLVLFNGHRQGFMSLRYDTKDTKSLLGYVGETWDEMAPAQPFAYTFLDERFDRLYTAEVRIGKIMGAFTSLAIFIACIGLFGLSTFTIQQKTKEIGIRKVLGASVTGIVGLLSKDFIKLVGIALIIAVPLAWLIMRTWLNEFAYRIEIRWWVFVLAGVIASSIAFITISVQCIKAASCNPVKSLRSEL